jgi:glycerol-3-phosphate acyltransferase PlsX
VLLDCGANADCKPEHLLQFAYMGAAFARAVLEIEHPRVGLLSIGEEAGKGNPLVKETHKLLEDAELGSAVFVGNVEGRDIMTDEVDVIVTDGFTGNVALKTLEGGMRALVNALFGVFAASDEAKAAADVLMPGLLPLYSQLDPDSYGGAMLLGVDGVCIISHGSSSQVAMLNACKVASDMVDHDVVAKLRAAIAAP